MGLNLGRAWGGLKPFRATPGRILADLGAFRMYLFSDMRPRWVPKGFWARSLVDFGKVWGAFGEGFAGIWNLSARLGADLGGLAKLGTDLAVLLRTLVGPTFRTGTPALPRYAPRSVTMRGGPPQRG